MDNPDLKQSKKKGFVFEHWQIIGAMLIIYDIVTVNLAFGLALWFRFDCQYSRIPDQYLDAWIAFAPVYTLFTLLVYHALRLYRSVWRFASLSELVRVSVATAVTGIFHVVAITACVRRMPISYYVFGILFQFLFTSAARFAYRIILMYQAYVRQNSGDRLEHVMLVGAGNAGQMILRDSKRGGDLKEKIVCIIDDNPNKTGRFIDGVPIVGTRDDILANVEKYDIDKIFVAIPSASVEEKRDILNICKETGCELKNLPGVYQLMSGEVTVSQMKDVAIEDLLGRDPIKVEMDEIFKFISGKTILVTGGGGSIGSELCRQIAGHAPKQLIIFDIYENSTYDIQQELKRKYPELDLQVLIGSVRDSKRIWKVFEQYKPDVVYHAAAHKHVPLMEGSPNEAIKNNAIGTYKTAYAAMMHGAQRFVLISTDKAVNPTNIMGASKRMCEMIIQSFDKKIKENRERDLPTLHIHSGDEFGSMMEYWIPGQDSQGHRHAQTEFVAVRFGNVLGSNGSVIPLFKRQIAEGGPVTVTHPDIIRYFMTIPEAVSLVLQAGTYAKGGEIFVLDMGAPVKIDDLARNLIKLSGLKPDVDIRIEYTGLRPGEKLYEEKLMAEEGLTRTKNSLIHIGRPIPFDTDTFLRNLQNLMYAAYDNREDIRELVAETVSTYHPAGEHGTEAKGAAYLAQIGELAEKE